MKKSNPKVDKYLIDGCMRCKFGGTPHFKINDWNREISSLRQLVLDCGLEEDLKWGVPCYTYQNKNVLLLSALRESAIINFLKGALIDDKAGFLVKPGNNSQSVRYLKFTNLIRIHDQKEIIIDYIHQAIELEASGRKVEFKKEIESIPFELTKVFEMDSNLKAAFYALTRGKQRGYIIYFSQPKSSESRFRRIEKSKMQILNGEGLNDKYKL